MIELNGEGWRASIRDRSDFQDGYEVWLFQGFDGDRVRLLQPDGTTREVSKYDAALHDMKPFALLRRSQLQALADALAKVDVFPAERRFAREVDILRDHLADMRRIAFKGKP